MNYVIIYAGANLICAFLLAMLLQKDIKRLARQGKQRLYDQALACQIFYLLADSVWVLVDGNVIRKNETSMGIINCIVYILLIVGAYTWYLYSEAVQKGVAEYKKIRSRFFEILGIVAILFEIFSFLLGKGYWVDNEGVYHHLGLFLFVMSLPFVYLITGSVKAFFRAFEKETSSEKRELVQAGVYPWAFLLFGLIQVFLYRVPVLCFGCSIAMVNVYVNNLFNMISADSLTQLNNRSQLQRFLSGAIRSSEKKQDLYVVMLDIDFFKVINDTYGHVEGDRALIVMASVLRGACGTEKNDIFISRYGGDEFAMVIRADSDEEIEGILHRMSQSLEEKVMEQNLPYPMRFSAGYSRFLGEGDTMTACLNRADTEMYKVKKEHKSVRK